MKKRYKLVEISKFYCKNQEVHVTEYHDGYTDCNILCKINNEACDEEHCKHKQLELDGFTKKEALEKMAKAMRQAKFPKTQRIPSWDELDKDYQAEYLGQAEAALDVLLKDK